MSIERRGWWETWGSSVVALLAINGAFALAFVADHDLGPGATWTAIVNAAVPGFIISTTISSLCMVVFRRAAPPLFHRTGPWTRWTALIAMLIVLAAIGTAIGIGLITLLGYIPPRWDVFTFQVSRTFRTAVIITLIFGVLTTLYQALRTRLDNATLALRTKERDEAEARRVASEAELASLESRVNPHFFFNTLNSIAALTREDPAGAERMTTRLASLMRSSLDKSSAPLVPLEQELETVRDYLEIEHVRFGDRLRYDIDAAAGARTALVPRLALQTIVENSVKYAVSPRREGACVTIQATANGGRLHVDVADDGPGFDGSHMPEGHGLALLRARLAMTFGGDATLAVDSQPGRTVVSIDLPVRDA